MESHPVMCKFRRVRGERVFHCEYHSGEANIYRHYTRDYVIPLVHVLRFLWLSELQTRLSVSHSQHFSLSTGTVLQRRRPRAPPTACTQPGSRENTRLTIFLVADNTVHWVILCRYFLQEKKPKCSNCKIYFIHKILKCFLVLWPEKEYSKIKKKQKTKTITKSIWIFRLQDSSVTHLNSMKTIKYQLTVW